MNDLDLLFVNNNNSCIITRKSIPSQIIGVGFELWKLGMIDQEDVIFEEKLHYSFALIIL
jgi:hypothetical protein